MCKAEWIKSRLPTKEDADLHGQVRWGFDKPGLLVDWETVRHGEPWKHSSAWVNKEPNE